MSDLLPFEPMPLLGRPHFQTILAAKLHFPLAPPSERRLVMLPDGDRIALRVSTPPAWSSGRPTVLMVHGLCGCESSPYLVRLARKLHREGVRAVRMNLRGCGSGSGLARKTYHSGRSEDVLAAVLELRREEPRSPLALVGFSLGGNIVLKLCGEQGPDARSLIERVIAVSPPVDLLASSRRLSCRENRLYERMFVKLLRADVARRQASFPDLEPIALPRRLTLMEFDEIYTAPTCGFEGALDYYTRASSLSLLSRIAIDCRILFARDDPLIDMSGLDRLDLPPNVRVTRTERGGHLGFLGVPGRSGFRWMDRVVMGWLLDGDARGIP